MADELGLLMPLLVRCTGRRICHILPNANAAARAPVTLMPLETRLWCDQDGWHMKDGPARETPAVAARSMDVVVAAHVIATLPEPQERLEVIHRMLVAGGTAFLIEFHPFAPYRRRWGGQGLRSLSLWRLSRLARECGFDVEASYALRPRASGDSTGMLLRHNWRLPSWFPLRAYAIRVCKTEVGMTLVGEVRPNSMSFGAPSV